MSCLLQFQFQGCSMVVTTSFTTLLLGCHKVVTTKYPACYSCNSKIVSPRVQGCCIVVTTYFHKLVAMMLLPCDKVVAWLLQPWHFYMGQVIKNVTGCRDTRTAKSKETRQGWSHKTVKYTTPLQRSFSIYVYNEKRYVGGLYTSLFCVIIPTLFPYFLPFWYPYILLHFQMFFITCSCLFFLAETI